jgi:hypothetical protein
MNLRSGRITQLQAIQSPPFNVKGRAVDPSSGNVLVSSDGRKLALGIAYGVNVVGVPAMYVSLEKAYAWEMHLSEKHLSEVPEGCTVLKNNGFFLGRQFHYLLIGYGEGFLYYAPAALDMPLDMRGPRSKAAAPKMNALFAPAPPGDELVIEVVYTEPAVNGDVTISRDHAMGGYSALNYVQALMGPEWAASAQTWEWLHIVGHALGGDNEVGNLVAGTFDPNTQMIPHERVIRDATHVCPPVTAKWEVNLYPESWLAMDITMTYSFDAPNGFTHVRHYIDAQTDIKYDKLQYDIWLPA